MKRIMLVLLLAALMILPTVVIAGTADYKDDYYYAGAPLGAGGYDPDDPNTSATSWNSSFTAGQPAGPIVLTSGQVIALALRNINIDVNKKLVRVSITYTGNSLSFLTADFGSVDGTPSGGGVQSETDNAGQYDLNYVIIPQPDWEYIVIQNPGPNPVTITNASIGSSCSPIPSLTAYGMMLLVLLLAGSAVWVMRRRSVVTAV